MEALQNILLEDIDGWWIKSEHVVVKFTVISDSIPDGIDPLVQGLALNMYERGKLEGRQKQIENVTEAISYLGQIPASAEVEVVQRELLSILTHETLFKEEI